MQIIGMILLPSGADCPGHSFTPCKKTEPPQPGLPLLQWLVDLQPGSPRPARQPVRDFGFLLFFPQRSILGLLIRILQNLQKKSEMII